METFVLLHMLGGWAREWDDLRAHMRAKIVAPDLPGHGSIEKGPAPAVVTLEFAANHVRAALGRDYDRLHLVGTSFGGAVAVKFAALYPDLVESLTLISTALTPAMSPSQMTAFELTRQGRDYDEHDNPLPRDIAATNAAFAIDDPGIHADIETSRTCAGAWIKPCWRGVAEADIVGLLAGLDVKTRLIFGEKDPYRRFEAEAAAVIGPHGTSIIEGCGSFPHRQCPKAIAAILAS